MARMFFSNPGCRGVDSGTTGRSYNADRQGFINVTDPADVKALKAGGYVEAGSVRTSSRTYWTCEDCSWDANINHCPRCGSDDLRKVES